VAAAEQESAAKDNRARGARQRRARTLPSP
jgi:hypothetical protein